MVALGVPGFKCFLIHSGVDEFPAVTRDQVNIRNLVSGTNQAGTLQNILFLKSSHFQRLNFQAREALVELRGTGATLLFHAECELEQEEEAALVYFTFCKKYPSYISRKYCCLD